MPDWVRAILSLFGWAEPHSYDNIVAGFNKTVDKLDQRKAFNEKHAEKAKVKADRLLNERNKRLEENKRADHTAEAIKGILGMGSKFVPGVGVASVALDVVENLNKKD